MFFFSFALMSTPIVHDVTHKSLEKRVRRLEKQNRIYHPHGDFKRDDFAWNGCVWLFFILIIVGFFLTIVLIPYYHPPLPPPPPPPAKSGAGGPLPPPQYVKHVGAPRRTVCTVGEVYDGAQLKMCVPSIHTPMAFDATIMDTQTPACHSFFNNSCGKWNAQHTNENRAFTFAHHKNQAQIASLVKNSTLANPLNDFYQSCKVKNDHESGVELKHVLNVITGNLRTHADLPTSLGRMASYGYSAPFMMSIERHPLEPRMIPLFTYDNLIVTEAQVIGLLNRVRSLLGYNVLDLQQRIQAVIKVMRTLKEKIGNDGVENIESFSEYLINRFRADVVRFEEVGGGTPLGAARSAAPNGGGSVAPFPSARSADGNGGWLLRGSHAPVNGWYNFFQALDGQGLRFQHDQDVWVIGRRYMKWLITDGLNAFDLFEWKAYLEFSIVYHAHQFEPVLEQNVYRTPNGVPNSRRGAAGVWRRAPFSNSPLAIPARGEFEPCIRITQHMLPGLVARAFLDQQPPETLAAVRSEIFGMVMDLKQTFAEQIRHSIWLSEPDRMALVQKLNHMAIRVIEPDEWHVEPFAGQIAPDRYDHNMNMIRRYRVQRNLQLWHKDVPTMFNQSQSAFFVMPLSEVNAYYSPTSNTMTVLAGILQLPFYSRDFNRVSKYAILGSVIGHELSHAIDAHGLFWDHMGCYKQHGILSMDGMRMFRNKTQCIVKEFNEENNQCSAAAAAQSYGVSTLSENIADLTGISLAFKALNAQGMSDKQYFFFVLAQAFCESYDLAHRCEAVQQDVHAVADFRIDLTFRNMPEFARVFSCGPAQRMRKEGSCALF